MADKLPVKANFTGADVTSLGEFAAGDTVPVANGGTGATTATAAQITLGGAPFLHLNDIINGDFRIAQAGTSFAAPASGAYDLDGWLTGNSTAAVFTVEQAAGSVAGRLARQVTITTAYTAVAAGDVVHDSTRIEGYNVEKYVGQTFIIAFRAKVPVAGVHCVSLRNSGIDRSYIKEINFPTANVWQDCSFTVVGGLPTAGTWNYTNGVGLDISFAHICGTTYQTTADTWQTGNFLGTANQVNDCATVGNVWALEKVTLNLGTVAAVNEIGVGQELARCQRYYETGQVYGWSYAAAGAALRVGYSAYKATKRVTPTIATSGVAYSNSSGLTVDTQSVGANGWYVTATAAGAYYVDGTFAASARL